MSQETKRGFFYTRDRYGDIADVRMGRVIPALVIAFLLFTTVMVGVYRLNTGEGAIITQVNGEKVPVTEVGWGVRVPFFTSMDTYSTVNRNIYFPSDYIQLEEKFTSDAQSGAVGFDIKTTDDKVVDVGAVMEYQIIDLVQYGVMNRNPEQQLQKAFDAAVFNHLQSLPSEKIINQIETVNVELAEKVHASGIEEKFGIKVSTVSLLRPTYTKKALDAMSEKQAIQAVAEGKLNAANSEAQAIEIVANAMKKQSDILANIPENQLDFNAKMTLYNNLKGQPNVVWVIPAGQPVTVVSK